MTTAPASTLALWLPWTDRAGRTSWLKLATFLALIAPAVWMLAELRFGWLSPRPAADLVKESGDWAMRVLIVSLAVTPLRYVARFNKFILIRRMVGLAALFYTLGHIAIWCVDMNYEWLKIAMEMFLRSFLTVGTAATLIMVALGVTSNDWSIQKLGAQRWNSLHTWTYLAAVLSLLHYFMEVRLDATEASLMTGFFVLLMAFRTVRRHATPGLINLSAMAVLCGLATALIEAAYYKISTSVGVWRVLSANLDFSYTIRPAWWVLGVGVLIAVFAHLRARFGPKPVRLRTA